MKIIEFLLAILALSMNLMKGTQGEVIDGWGMQMLIVALGLGGIFFLMRERSKEKCNTLNGVSVLFALFTVFGQSYMQTQSFDVLLADGFCIVRTIIFVCGYTLIYKNCILFAGWLLEQVPEVVWRREPRGKVENWLFERYSFPGTLLLAWLLEIPWLVCFFPGTLEPDAGHQLLMAFGYAQMTGHHPVIVTKIMGKCMYIGQHLFGTDMMGVFVYTFLQFTAQSLVFAYAMYVLGRMKTPLVLRWGTLIFYCIYPIFPIWGYTMVKDSGYYILILLFVVTLVHLLYEQDKQPKWWQTVLLMVSVVGIGCFRKDGCAVVMMTLLCGFVAYKKYRKIFIWGLVACVAGMLVINVGYMRYENISQGSVKETLSIPLQQTARYVREHYDEITEEELEVLQTVFTVDVPQLAELYDPEFADPVKYVFVSEPDNDALRMYFGVWWKQFLKHPDTYVQAFLNHTYGYFYPDKRESNEGEDIGVFEISETAYFDVDFGIESDGGRNLLEGYSRLIKRVPVVGMLYSVGLHTWILLGCVLYLSAKKKWKELVIYLPGMCILAVCVISPVNACVRYMLPVMALLPIHLGWLMQRKD